MLPLFMPPQLRVLSILGSASAVRTAFKVPSLCSSVLTQDKNIELCRFSKDGTKPFLFCTVQKGNRSITVVWDMSTWDRIGFKRLLRKPACVMSISLDGKYLAHPFREITTL
ncbi:hypothetical protein SSX86_018560 [Deinandra increscens subsp. villosa]|uniref:Uncharacterized protein n=1 Tax=Deinandra increscens subsp. villosa TaxID=3103831 RepID=A0AAP0GUV6_9ASTR